MVYPAQSGSEGCSPKMCADDRPPLQVIEVKHDGGFWSIGLGFGVDGLGFEVEGLGLRLRAEEDVRGSSSSASRTLTVRLFPS